MRRFLVFFLILFSMATYAQFFDNFSDGNFTQNPIWKGTEAKFTVNQNQLQLNDETATTGYNKAYLATESEAILSAEWSCSLSLNVVLTSANYVRFYVVSDTSNLSSSLNGYFVLLGGTTKEISLYRQNGTVLTKLVDGIDSRLPIASGYAVEINVLRDSVGEWELWSKLSTDSVFMLEGKCHDKTLLKASYSGLFFNYSVSNITNFACDSIGAKGNPYVKPQHNFSKNDIVFTEIMADPEPSIKLPNTEFLEIYNRTNQLIDLTGWKLEVGDKSGIILEGELLPYTYALLCASSKMTDFMAYGKVIGVSSCPTISNSGALITLRSDEDKVMAWVDFSSVWYGDDAFKKEGGWSLERINVDYLDNNKENWMPSQSNTGGTPSGSNSVEANLLDQRQPVLDYLAVIAPDTLLLCFSKSMEDTLIQDIFNYQTENMSIQSLIIQQPQTKVISLVLSDSLKLNEEALLQMENLRCVDGLLLDPISLRVSEPQMPLLGDVVINEVLFNPKGDGVDYVEILNISDKVLDLSALFLTKRKEEFLDERTPIINRQALFFPDEYWVLTSDPVVVCSQFSCPQSPHFATMTLPSMNDDEGSVILILNNGTIIDDFAYSDKMHHPFVVNPEGVSLERVNPFMPTQYADNWQSASFESGYGTPGFQNSQYSVSQVDVSDAYFVLDNETFTPDNDGYLDLLQVNYKLPQDGFIAYVDVFDANGLRMKRILNGELLGTEGSFFWNGLSDKGLLCNVGVYVLFVEAIHPSGQRIQKKIICVLSAR